MKAPQTTFMFAALLGLAAASDDIRCASESIPIPGLGKEMTSAMDTIIKSTVDQVCDHPENFIPDADGIAQLLGLDADPVHFQVTLPDAVTKISSEVCHRVLTAIIGQCISDKNVWGGSAAVDGALYEIGQLTDKLPLHIGTPALPSEVPAVSDVAAIASNLPISSIAAALPTAIPTAISGEATGLLEKIPGLGGLFRRQPINIGTYNPEYFRTKYGIEPTPTAGGDEAEATGGAGDEETEEPTEEEGEDTEEGDETETGETEDTGDETEDTTDETEDTTDETEDTTDESEDTTDESDTNDETEDTSETEEGDDNFDEEEPEESDVPTSSSAAISTPGPLVPTHRPYAPGSQHSYGSGNGTGPFPGTATGATGYASGTAVLPTGTAPVLPTGTASPIEPSGSYGAGNSGSNSTIVDIPTPVPEPSSGYGTGESGVSSDVEASTTAAPATPSGNGYSTGEGEGKVSSDVEASTTAAPAVPSGGSYNTGGEGGVSSDVEASTTVSPEEPSLPIPTGDAPAVTPSGLYPTGGEEPSGIYSSADIVPTSDAAPASPSGNGYNAGEGETPATTAAPAEPSGDGYSTGGDSGAESSAEPAVPSGGVYSIQTVANPPETPATTAAPSGGVYSIQTAANSPSTTSCTKTTLEKRARPTQATVFVWPQ
ncbi:hypothetical protein DPSP01_000493 [Paraphaeosphaeria sporulosa]